MLFRFRELPVYKSAKEFRKYIKKIIQKFPAYERADLADQIKRAATSICLNIAEGSNRTSDKDKAHFLNQALTSLEEVVAAFDLALDDKYITQTEMNEIVSLGENIGKQLISFAKYLQNKG